MWHKEKWLFRFAVATTSTFSANIFSFRFQGCQSLECVCLCVKNFVVHARTPLKVNCPYDEFLPDVRNARTKKFFFLLCALIGDHLLRYFFIIDHNIQREHLTFLLKKVLCEKKEEYKIEAQCAWFGDWWLCLLLWPTS